MGIHIAGVKSVLISNFCIFKYFAVFWDEEILYPQLVSFDYDLAKGIEENL